MPLSLPRPFAPLAVALLLAAVPGAARASAVAVSPASGTPDANPATQISLWGVPRARIASVRVVGTRSGAHAGRLRAYSGDRGASFVPARPFVAGERVAVVARLRGHGDRSASTVRTAFTVARLAPIPPVLNLPATQPGKLEHFTTRPDLLAPLVTVTRDGSASSAATLLTPLPSPVIHPGSRNTVSIAPVGPGGPMILDAHGKLVWFRPLTAPDVAANLAVQRWHGRRVLTWWQGPVTVQAFGLGEGMVADASYRTVARVRAGNGYRVDIHELVLDGDDALVTVYSPVIVGGRPVLDSIIQRIDVRTGLVLWEWHALGHIPLSESYANSENSAANDAFHINSIQPMGDGLLLVSARDTAAVYAIAGATGRIVWRLGGKRSTFRMGRGARFWLQHDARILPGDRVSLFDDEAGPPRRGVSRALVLQLDRRRRTATVVRSLTRPAETSAQSEGSVQALGGGGVFVGFGSAGPFSEFSPEGRLVFDAALPEGDGSYRTVRAAWRARPVTRPDVVARGGSVAVSWNGATEVARWEVVAGSSVVASGPRTGFETTLALSAATGTTVTARALDAHGKVLGTSAPVVVAP
jgi:hypothetical protein